MQSYGISITAPTSNQLLQYISSSKLWTPTTLANNIIPNPLSTGSIDLTNTTNQIITGSNPNLTTLNFPASSGAITLNFPSTADTIPGRATTDTLTNKTVLDNSFTIANNSDTTKKVIFDNSGAGASTTLTLKSTSSTSQSLNFPNITATDTLVADNFIQTLTNKFFDSSNVLCQAGDTSKRIGWDTSASTSGKTLTIAAAQTNSETLSIPNVGVSDSFTTNNTTATLTNKSLNSANCQIIDNADSTKQITFSISGNTAGKVLTISTAQTNSETLSIPNVGAADSLVSNNTTATLTNKSLRSDNCQFVDNTDSTKQTAIINSSASAGAVLTLSNNQTASKILSFPNISGNDVIATLGLANSFSGANNFSGINTFSNATNATTTSTGSIITSGGIGIAKDVWSAGNVYFTTSAPLIISTTSNQPLKFQTKTATGTSSCVLFGNDYSSNSSGYSMEINRAIATTDFQLFVAGSNGAFQTGSTTGDIGIRVQSGGLGKFYIGNGNTSWAWINSNGLTLPETTNQVVLGTTNTTTINSIAPAASQTCAIYDSGQTNTDIELGARRVIGLPATGTTTITVAQSGCIFYMIQATGNTTINLPTVFNGAYYKFVVVATADGAHTQTIASTTTNVYGSLVSVPGTPALSYISAKTNSVLSATAANVKIGDWIEFIGADSVYFMTFFSNGAAAGWSFS